MFSFARLNIIYNSLLAQLVKYNIHTRKIKFIHTIIYHIGLLFFFCVTENTLNLLLIKLLT